MPPPPGFHTVTPYMILRDPAAAIDFYKRAFSAAETARHADPDGGIMHAEIRIGDSMIMMGGETPRYPDLKGIEAQGGSPVHIFLYVDDADSQYAQAVTAGAQPVEPLADKEYGRSGGVKDPFGLTWWITAPPKA